MIVWAAGVLARGNQGTFMNDWISFTDLSVEPRRSRLGLAVYARAFVPAGAVLVRLGIGEITETRDFRTIELGEGVHEDHPYLRYVNHSCDPNSFIDKKDRVLRALRPIHPFEEITFDYLVNESEIASPFQCDCGAPNCRRLIRKGARQVGRKSPYAPLTHGLPT